MIHGIGVDILNFEKLRYVYERADDPFIVRTFTNAEKDASEKTDNKLAYLAGRFAGKEAVFKALGITAEGVSLREIEILNDDKGAPYVNLYGGLREVADERRIMLHISLSYEAEEAIAYVIAEYKD